MALFGIMRVVVIAVPVFPAGTYRRYEGITVNTVTAFFELPHTGWYTQPANQAHGGHRIPQLALRRQGTHSVVLYKLLTKSTQLRCGGVVSLT